MFPAEYLVDADAVLPCAPPPSHPPPPPPAFVASKTKTGVAKLEEEDLAALGRLLDVIGFPETVRRLGRSDGSEAAVATFSEAIQGMVGELGRASAFLVLCVLHSLVR